MNRDWRRDWRDFCWFILELNMSCFWDGLIQSLPASYFTSRGLVAEGKPSPEILAKWMQEHNRPTTSILLNGGELTSKQVLENLEWVRSYNPAQVGSGYYCGTADPFLLLFAELFNCSIEHKYRAVDPAPTIHYSNISCPRPLIRVSSNRGHFSFRSVEM